jgi:hypothetical protein
MKAAYFFTSKTPDTHMLPPTLTHASTEQLTYMATPNKSEHLDQDARSKVTF